MREGGSEAEGARKGVREGEVRGGSEERRAKEMHAKGGREQKRKKASGRDKRGGERGGGSLTDRRRVGISLGPVSGGVVGVENPRFSIFGDTVVIAARMASTAEPSKKNDFVIHMSEAAAKARCGEDDDDYGGDGDGLEMMAMELEMMEMETML
eukprot:768077-Hanusia_phi.AAC.2